jgi:hypothetical protein
MTAWWRRPAENWRLARLTLVVLMSASCAPAPVATETSSGFIDNDDIRLSYRLDTPAGIPPFPAVVVGHGSGRTLKEDCRRLADQMLRRGFATLCYDKRGVGQSTGTYVNVGTRESEAHFPRLASDMAAGVAFLRSLARVDGHRIGLIGPSQAGWIIPIAARSAGAAFMILLVGPTVSVGEEMHYSRYAERSAMPAEEISILLAAYDGPRGFDPRPVLETLDVPGLWLLGAADRSIPTVETVAILDRFIAAGRPFSRVVYPGVDHDLRGAMFWADIDKWLIDRKLMAAR